MNPHDAQLDAYRALVMIYILCVIHVLYWLPSNFLTLKSAILFEMPVIFFISGAAIKVKGGDNCRSTIQIISNRFRRVIIPYYIYAAVSLGIIAGLSTISSGDYNLGFLSGRDYIDILLFQRIPQIPFVYHLWFIAPYIILLCSFHFQTRIISKMRYPAIYLPAACAIFIISTHMTDNRLIRNCLCYNCFLISGYLFYRKISRQALSATTALLIGSIILWLTAGGATFSPMQAHKFPPDTFFLLFGFTALCLLGIIFSYVKIPDNIPILHRWNRCGYTIYLYQNFSFIIASLILDATCPHEASVMKTAVAAILIFTISTITSYIWSPLESKIQTVCLNRNKSLTQPRQRI